MEINIQTKAGLITIIRVLRWFWTRGPASRAALARELELDKSPLTKVCDRLLKAGLIHQVREGAAGSQGGRRPSLLDINPERGAIAGLEIGPKRLSMVYTDLQGRIIQKATGKISPSDAGIEKLIETVQNSFSSNIRGFPVLGGRNSSSGNY